jgi:peptide/nickel transport system substrate-binding protein
MTAHLTTFSRRRALVALGGASLTLLAACGAPASPTAAPKAVEPTKPAAPAATTAPAAAPTTAPAAAATTAPTTAPAAAATTAPAAQKPQTGGSLTIAELGALTKTLHPYPDNASYTSTWTEAASFIWNGGLLSFDGNTLEYKPDMATAYKVSDDGKTFTFTLRDDLKWSDGTPVTVDDFLYAYEMAKDPKNDYVGLDDVDRIASFTAPDPKTIVVVLKEVFARDIATGVASGIGPVPSKIWKGKPWNDPTGNPEILKPTVLMGPYQIKEFRQAEVATFEPVATHYAGKPSLETITLRPAQQPTVAYELLKSGQAQWAPNIPPAQYDEAKKNPDLTMLEWTPANGSYRNLEFNLTRDFFKDKRVREALARSISREDLIQVAENNLGKPQYSFVNPANTKWYNANVEKYDFDLAKSKALLEQAGYKLDGGVLKGANGQPVRLSVYYPTTSAPRGKIAAYLQQQFKQLGIELEVRGLDFNAYTDQVGKKKDFDLSLGTYGGGSIDPDLAAKAQIITNGQQNVTGFSNEQIDTAFKAGAVEQDTAKRKAAYDQIQQMVVAELPVFYLYSLLRFSPISKKVSGVQPSKLDSLLGDRAFMTWSVAK